MATTKTRSTRSRRSAAPTTAQAKLAASDRRSFKRTMKRFEPLVHLRQNGKQTVDAWRARAFGAEAGSVAGSVIPVPKLHERLDGMAALASFRLGEDAEGAKRVAEWVQAKKDLLEDPEKLRERGALLAAAYGRDQQAIQRLEKLAYYSYQCVLAPNSVFGKFFETITLEHNEKPMLVCRWPEYMDAYCLGKEGKPLHRQPVCEGEEKAVDLCWLVTDTYEVPICDIYHGFDVREWAVADIDMMGELMMAKECLLKNFLLAGGPQSLILGPGEEFVTDGAKSGRHYVAHPKVNIDNLPTSNYIELANNTATTLPRRELFIEIIRYMKSWGEGAFPDGDMGQPCIIIPSAHCHGFLKDVEMFLGPDCVACDIYESLYGRITYGGYTFEVIPDNTLDPNQGLAYFGFRNKCVGSVFEKPALEGTKTWQDESCNKEFMNAGHVFGVGGFTCQAPNIGAVRYKTPAK